MERRMLMAVLLSFVAVSLYGMATGKCSGPPPKDPAKEGAEEDPGKEKQPVAPAPPTQPTSPQDPTAPGPVPPVQPVPQPDPQPEEPQDPAGDPPPHPLDQGPVLWHTVRTPELELQFVNRGGALAAVRALNDLEDDGKTPLDLVVPPSLDNLIAQVDDTFLKPTDGAPGDANREDDAAGWMRSIRWTHNEAAERETPETDVIYDVRSRTGTWRKQFVLPTETRRYEVLLRLSYTPDAGQATAPVPVKILVASGLFRGTDTGAAFQEPNSIILRMAMESEPSAQQFGIPLPSADINANDLRILAARNAYYLAGYYTGADEDTQPDVVRWWGTGEVAKERPTIETFIADFFREHRGRDWKKDKALAARIKTAVANMNFGWLVVDVPAEGGKIVEIPLYVGPVDRHVLGQDVYAQLDSVITYRAAPDILADALLGIYDLFLSLFGNAGVAVILMTLVVRGAMMPLSIKNQLSMRVYSRKIAKLKPKLDVMKKKFGNNPKRIREEQAKLYREHGVGFPTGCLMMLVQLPIFFALFSSLRTEFSLRGASFLWIQDLSGPDKLIDFGHVVLDIGILTIFSINILPLIMVVLSIWQQKMMPKPADEQQAQQMRMMKWLPIIFAVILYNYTAALSLYMVLSSAVAIAESRIVRWKDEGSADAPAGEWPKKAEPATT